SPKLDKLQSELFRTGLFNFTRWYFGSHNTQLSKSWTPDDAVLADLAKYLREHGTQFTDETFQKDLSWIKRQLTREMFTTAFNVDEADAVFLRMDPEVEKAVELMPGAETLLENARKVISQRTSQGAR